MNITIKQKFDDFYNARVIMDCRPGQRIVLRKGRLELRDGSAKQTEGERKEIKALISSLLRRIDVGAGPLTEGNVQSFVDKILPMHHSFCNPGAMMANPALRKIVEKRIAALRPAIAEDFNMIRCEEQIEKTANRIRSLQWQLFNPLRMLGNALARVTGSSVDRTLEKELAFTKWRHTRDVKFRDALQDSLIGLKLGISHQTGAEKNGWSGSFFWKQFESNARIGVYKPSDQDSISPGSPHAFARFRFHFIPSKSGVLVSQSGKAHIAEAGARIAAESFHRALMDMEADGIKPPFEEKDAIVPDTRIVEVNFTSGPTTHGIGSFQIFLKRCLSMTEAFGIDKKSFLKVKAGAPDLSRSFLPQFQWLKLFHYLIFAQDDHAENTMAIYDREGKVVGLKAIDNGQSFPAEPLGQNRIEKYFEKKILSMKPMNGLKHPLAKEKILPFFREFIKYYGAGGYLDRLGQDLYAFYQDPANYLEGQVEDPKITEGRVRLLKNRFAVLQRLFADQERPLVALMPYLKGGGLDDARN